jgi:endonuclease/exonuclease/phosphatase family metal-dependent hydrolase
MRRWQCAIGLAALLLFASRGRLGHHGELRVATFNIEKFPKTDGQLNGALDEILASGASVIGVQEIGDGQMLVTGARARLGDSWRYVDDGAPRFALGVLYDGSQWHLASRRIHEDTRVEGRGKPVLDVRLAPVGAGETLRLLVVHLVSGSAGRSLRARQYEGLVRVATAATDPNERLVVLGDFNATEPADRSDLARLSAAADLVWASEPLACTAFWERDDGCPRSRLDHMLAWTRPASIHATGACAREGCEWQASCPIYAEAVSDHCPVVATFETP